MDPMVIVIGGGLVLLAILATLFFAKSRTTAQLTVLQEQVRQKEMLLQEQLSARALLQTEKEQLLGRLSKTEALLENSQNALKEAKQTSESLGAQLKLEFAEIAHKVMQSNSEQLRVKSEEKIGELLKPLKTELGEFKKKVDDVYVAEAKDRHVLKAEIDRLITMSQQVSQEANNLTTALKGNNKTQGNWGEMLLESILENSGLIKGNQFVTQEFIRDAAGNIIKDEEGRGLQPDVMVKYPDQRTIIIDSKVSLVHWEQYVNSEEETERNKVMSLHLSSLKSHIDGLSKKNYPRYAKALDYVLLFVPIEPAFLEAVKKDTNLWKYAYDKNIMLVSPTNLLAVLKIIADLWKVEQQNQNAIEIAEKAGMMYDKFVGFISNLEEVGKKIEAAQESYKVAFNQLSTGRGNLVGRAEELKKMGAKAQKQIPDKIIYELK
ncbi:DNA recombination protein RmuC [Sediminibacterium sp. TEGAF015]|uniref:DNA recombination protein RmuC n=1 Tax=Sediminibacterium sp. TEGAF015 TaxID=575378 RepID=UPI00220206ED|nr:DNA recombination protein RmuC [Sediminibacterium sp. TEGAF015]BDQ12750.1 DNA recombination protein RmuC [Sediminibacterium sp. TEGAF015]